MIIEHLFYNQPNSQYIYQSLTSRPYFIVPRTEEPSIRYGLYPQKVCNPVSETQSKWDNNSRFFPTKIRPVSAVGVGNEPTLSGWSSQLLMVLPMGPRRGGYFFWNMIMGVAQVSTRG